MIPIETRITVWLGLSAKLLMCVILLASVYFHAEKRAEKVSQEKILLIENRLKKGGVLCFFPAAVLLAAAFLLQNEDVSAVPAVIALNAGEFIFLTSFIRLLWKR